MKKLKTTVYRLIDGQILTVKVSQHQASLRINGKIVKMSQLINQMKQSDYKRLKMNIN
jgi:hypothetical protein